MRSLLPALTVGLLAAGAICQGARPAAPGTKQASIRWNGKTVDLRGDPAIFTEVKVVVEPGPSDRAGSRQGDDAPEHLKFILDYASPGNVDERYDARWIRVIPLSEAGNASFSRTYAGLANAAEWLRKTLKARPASIPYGFKVPVWNFGNAGQTIHSKIQYIDTPFQSGMLFINSDDQEGFGNAVYNGHMDAIYQGLDRSGAYYIVAELNICHPRLPNHMPADFENRREKNAIRNQTIGRQMESWPDRGFSPPIGDIRRVIESLEIR